MTRSGPANLGPDQILRVAAPVTRIMTRIIENRADNESDKESDNQW